MPNGPVPLLQLLPNAAPARALLTPIASRSIAFYLLYPLPNPKESSDQ